MTIEQRVLLLVEDDAAFAHTLSRSFERRGYKVLLAENVDEASRAGGA
jgi:two-component system response regulator RegA